jgi:protoporphyrin/coproporphyrin ferrochelatase
MAESARKVAIVLMNLGGPDRLESVPPFLFNLFYDPAITEMPAPFRWLFATWITRKRQAEVQENYRLMGGKTPLLEETLGQARALEAALADLGDVRCFLAMRYWYPFSEDAAREVKAFGPDRVLLLPLYPQYSNATTGSSLAAWRRAALALGLDVPTRTVCCYPTEPGFVRAHADLIRRGLERAAAYGRPRLLFSAHGLPEAFIKKGDPYRWQVERTCDAVVRELAVPDLDWLICYQSRVGPQKWIEPYTDAEVERAAKAGLPIVMTPIAFVSEHIETLVEMDHEYAKLAKEAGAPGFVRVPTPTVHPEFIGALAALVRRHLEPAGATDDLLGPELGRLCPPGYARCPCRVDAGVAPERVAA